MPLFQKSVLKKFLSELDQDLIHDSYNRFQTIFQDPIKQQNILSSKEEQYQEGFLRELFVNVLGYTVNPDPNFNLITEKKNESNGKKADGAIISQGVVKAVIELKSAKTVDLATIETQAFGYKNNQKDCDLVITSNFRKLRFYISNAVEYEEFDLFNLDIEHFRVLWLCLSKDHLLNGTPLKIKNASNNEEENITKKLYRDYATFRKALFQDVCEKNSGHNRLLLFKKTQKLLDRFLFLFFAEDRGLVSANWTRRILHDWTDLKDRYDSYIPLYTRFRKNFEYLNTGFKSKEFEIFAYNGGLFYPDEILDSLIIDDELLFNGSLKLSNYDFDSEVDVNILGHIFEHSLNERDELQSEDASGVTKITKRKKDGVFYTPKFITKYIVDNTIGKLCFEQKKRLQYLESDFEFISVKAAKSSKKIAAKRGALKSKLDHYQNWLLKLKIIDPACGSGAFLNQALDFLISEHSKVDELRARLLGGSIVLSDVENSILENNLYGVDINEEAVEIAKLSLWLRTARRGRKLSSLNTNIRVGNSLINDPIVAGEKVFNWETEFEAVFNNGKFDVVIGNPPYVPNVSITDDEKTFYSKFYKTSEYQINTFSLFIEKSIDILNSDGVYGLIVPNYFVSTRYDRKLRQLMFIEHTVYEIINTYNVFEDAVVDTVIVLGMKSTSGETMIKSIGSEMRTIASRLEALSEGKWSYEAVLNFKGNPYDAIVSFNDTQEYASSFTLKHFLDFKKGMQPYEQGKGVPPQSREMMNSKVYHAKFQKDNSYFPLLTSSSVKRHFIKWNGEWIKYGRNLAAPRQWRIFEGERILLNRIVSGTKFDVTYVKDVYINNSDVFNLLPAKLNGAPNISLKALSGLIGSELCAKYFLDRNVNLNRQAFPKVNVSTLETFPVADKFFTVQNEIEILVDELSLQKINLYNLSSQFLTLLKAKFPVIMVNRKLENWFDLSTSEFLKELQKRKVVLTLSEQSDWLTYFEKEKAQTSIIKNLIIQSENDIDEIVDSLYEEL